MVDCLLLNQHHHIQIFYYGSKSNSYVHITSDIKLCPNIVIVICKMIRMVLKAGLRKIKSSSGKYCVSLNWIG